MLGRISFRAAALNGLGTLRLSGKPLLSVPRCLAAVSVTFRIDQCANFAVRLRS